MLGALGALVSLIWFLGFFSSVYTQRLADLRRESARNEKLAMLGRLVGGMSHELSTPLATILLGSNELVDMTREGDPEAAKMARTIADEARRASDIIGLLRGHIRPDQRAATVNLDELVPAYAEKELDRLGFAGERVFVTPEPVPTTVLEVGLCQVLTNLLSNAAQATSPRAGAPRGSRSPCSAKRSGSRSASPTTGRASAPTSSSASASHSTRRRKIKAAWASAST